ERLIEKNPEELQKEGILPIGTLEEWRSSLEEKVLVGLVADRSNYVRFIQNRFYWLPERVLRKGWQEARYVALYVKQGVAGRMAWRCMAAFAMYAGKGGARALRWSIGFLCRG
ncbi:MAG: hypothetical protein LOD92_04225, partial [Bacillales bacterium]